MKSLLTLAAAGFALTSTAFAGALTFAIDGAPLTGVDATADFGTMLDTDGTDGYVEDGILFDYASGVSRVGGFDPFAEGSVYNDFYYGSGTGTFVEISLASPAKIFGLEVRIGDGFTGFGRPRAPGSTTLVFEVWSDGAVIGGGVEAMALGSMVSFIDPVGFDFVRLAAGPNISVFGDYQAIVLDDVSVDFTDADAVPVPAAAFLFAPALAGIALRRKKASQVS